MRPLFPTKGRDSVRVRVSKLQNITFRGFNGGLNTQSSDLSLDARYLVALRNFRRTASGSQKVRWGSKWFSDVSDVVSGNIVDMVYYANSIVAVTSTGELCLLDNDGNRVAIWNSAIAALQPGAPAGWSSGLDSIDFVPFKSQLLVHNGVDKPLTLNQAGQASYLNDLATGSNTNTPIGKYGCVVSNYHCVAGIAAAPTSIYVSSRATAGTFFGDAPPNDGIIIDVGAYAPEGAPEIRGIAGYRSTLIVFFSTQAVPITLGVYDGAAHTPTFPESLPAYGLIGHRCIVQVDKDLLFGGFDGICSVERNIISGLTDTDSLSDLIEPTYRRSIGALTDDQQLKFCFMIHDRLLHDTVTYVPGGDAFVYSANQRPPNKYKSWSEYGGPAWTSACRSVRGRVFYSKGTKIFQEGNDIFSNENYYADRLLDRDANWATSHLYSVDDLAFDTVTLESYKCIVGHTSGSVSFSQDRIDQASNPKWVLWEGDDIDIELELPWLDGKDPMRNKFSKFISMATKGTAEFTVKAWVDNLHKDADGVLLYDPALEITFVGNDARGFGYDAGPYGGGRRSNDPRLYAFPLQFKNLKIAVSGAVKKPLELSTFSFLYAKGKFTR